MEPGTFADFMDQLPTELIRLFFIFLALLVMTLAAFFLLRARRTNGASTSETPEKDNQSSGGGLGALFSGGEKKEPDPVTTAPPAPPPTGGGDIPDIDTLLAMTAPEAGVPASTSTPPATENTLRQPGLVNVRLTAGGVVDAAEMLLLLRDRDTNKLVVQIGEHAYTGAEAEIVPEFRRLFVTLMKELLEIAPKLSKGARAAKPAPAATAPPQPTEVEEDEGPQPTTLAGQIEQRLQRRLAETGEFTGRSIHVRDAPDGGVRIEVDGESFASVGEVSDPAVKAFIAKVVADWQESQ